MIDPTHRRLALVEDDERTRKAMKLLLELEGFDVEPFTSVESAAGSLQDRPFHGLIAEHSTPGSPGLELLLSFRRHQPSLRCVVISGTHPPERALLDGVHWLLKPVDFDLLVPLLQ